MLIVFPLGLLGTAAVFDLIHLGAGAPGLAEAAFWMIAAGIITGAVAAVFGWIDWTAIPSGTRAWSVGLTHGLGNAVVLVLFAVSWWLRRDHPAEPGTVPVVLSVAGLALALVTGWLGGELVDRLGVGVEEGAHLNAPNSLSGRPAMDRGHFPPPATGV